jgi:hypothetical protein
MLLFYLSICCNTQLAETGYSANPTNLFEIWVEGKNVEFLYSRQGQIDGEFNDAIKQRIIDAIDDELTPESERTYGPF